MREMALTCVNELKNFLPHLHVSVTNSASPTLKYHKAPEELFINLDCLRLAPPAGRVDSHFPLRSWRLSFRRKNSSSHETARKQVCGLSELTGSWFLRRDIAVEFFFLNVFLALWAPQAERHLVPFYLREDSSILWALFYLLGLCIWVQIKLDKRAANYPIWEAGTNYYRLFCFINFFMTNQQYGWAIEFNDTVYHLL